ncbi:MAG TPA: hypothetical protein DER10_11890 [Elusimicrobia bacterium]|nr:hypothetical protein [Elusimicrobiota bacterium]
MAFESILFEKELVVPKREKLSAGLLGAAGIWLLGALLLAQWTFRQGSFFSSADSAGFARINAYTAHLSSGGFWSIFKPVLGGFTLDTNPPLYYLSYFPVFKFLTSNLTEAMLAVNSFYLLIIAFSVFLAVKKSRNNMSGWLGTAFAFGMPFTLEMARHPEPELVAMAMTAAAYCCYINSEDFECPRWSFWFSVFFSLGFFAHRHFWVCALPLVPFIIPAIAGYITRDEILKGLFPGLALNLPWYAMFLAYRFLGLYRPESQNVGFWTYFSLSAQAASLPFFVIGGLALLWMYFSVFMPYSNKKIVAAWFWAPYLALTYIVKTADPRLIYPVLLPFAMAAAVMSPNLIRKPLLGLTLWLTMITQSGLVGPFGFGNYPIAGLESPSRGGYHAGEILESLAHEGPGPFRVLVAGGKSGFNSGSFNIFAAARGAAGNIFFYDQADLAPALADYIVFKTPGYGEVSGPQDGLSSVVSEPWFNLIFEKKKELDLNDTSKILVYAKRRFMEKPFAEGTYAVKKYDIGGLSLQNAKLTLENFDPRKGVYSKALVFAPYAVYEGADIYGLTLELADFRAAASRPDISGLVVSGIGSVKVISAKISAYAVERFIAGRLKLVTGPEVTIGRTITLHSETPREINAELSVPVEKGSFIEIKLEALEFAGYHVPDFFVRNFIFTYNLALSPYRLSFKTFKAARQLLVIGSEEGVKIHRPGGIK